MTIRLQPSFLGLNEAKTAKPAPGPCAADILSRKASNRIHRSPVGDSTEFEGFGFFITSGRTVGTVGFYATEVSIFKLLEKVLKYDSMTSVMTLTTWICQ